MRACREQQLQERLHGDALTLHEVKRQAEGVREAGDQLIEGELA